MREIKFRGFFKDDKEMFNFKHLNLDNFYKSNNVELMQYTGLKDKNGLEIYEGDIISCQNKVGQVKYEKSMFVGDFIKARGHLFYISDECIVVGNIYENKDLLNTKG